MVESDKRKFRELIQMLGANYRADVTTPLLQAYWIGLCDLDYDRLNRAVTKAMRGDEFMPTVARLRELSGKGRDVKPYHMPYKGLPEAEAKRIQASWEEAKKIPGGAPPVHVGELVGQFMASQETDGEPEDASVHQQQGGRP